MTKFNPINSVVKLVGPRVGMASLTVRNHAPEIYLVGGIVAGVAAAVMFAKAHKKSERVFEEPLEQAFLLKNDIAPITVTDVDGEQVSLTDKERQLALLSVYKDILVLAVRLYGPAVLLGSVSIGCILASHGVLRGRNRGLISALALFERGFSQYRGRVIDELGKEADERFFYGAEEVNVTELIPGENGKNSKVKTKQNRLPETVSPMIYSRVFDESNINWYKDRDLSEYFLRSVQTQMNDHLYLKGHVMLNTVYEALGFSETPEGAVVGWSKNLPGDGQILFGLDDNINQNPGDNRFVLDFNVQGVVYQAIGER